MNHVMRCCVGAVSWLLYYVSCCILLVLVYVSCCIGAVLDYVSCCVGAVLVGAVLDDVIARRVEGTRVAGGSTSVNVLLKN